MQQKQIIKNIDALMEDIEIGAYNVQSLIQRLKEIKKQSLREIDTALIYDFESNYNDAKRRLEDFKNHPNRLEFKIIEIDNGFLIVKK